MTAAAPEWYDRELEARFQAALAQLLGRKSVLCRLDEGGARIWFSMGRKGRLAKHTEAQALVAALEACVRDAAEG